MTDITGVDIQKISQQAIQELEQAKSPDQLEQWRIKYLGRRGAVPLLLRRVKEVPPSQRREIGKAANALRHALTQLFNDRHTALSANATAASRQSSLSASQSPGHYHPLTLTIRRLQRIFAELSFTLVEGPQVETAEANFDNLNMPLEHPARAETDTFYLDNGLVLRTSTSPVQVRAALEYDLHPPFKIFSPGRVFRSEKIDATHSHTFHQFEGLAIGEYSLADFKGVATYIYSRFFDQDVTTRLRPHYFPFVEPGLEVDISCVFCHGSGCRICKQSGWIEVMGAGMVHPVVLKNMNVDPTSHQGYAFGGAIDRLAMLLYGIDDIRHFWSGDLRVLRQFTG